ncbi:MAG: hypothetical protein ACYSP9_04000, partial [Planctomycetota bacterium]
MDKGLVIWVVLLSGVLIASAFGADTTGESLLRDGFGLAGVDGGLVRQDSNSGAELWFFRLQADVNDGRSQVGTGTRLQLLPSSTLEKITIDAEGRVEKNYKLWGRVTKYKDRNFIFPAYFLPLTKASEPGAPPLEKPREGTKEGQPTEAPNSVPAEHTEEDPNSEDNTRTEQGPAFYDSNDVLPIPKEMIEKLKKKPRRPVKRIDIEAVKVAPVKPPEYKSIQRDLVLVDRTGFLLEQQESLPMFGLDALGRNVQRRSLHLLPCYVLERAEQKLSEEVEPLRFKIAGIVTKY